jgi:Uma2 family endonuclease
MGSITKAPPETFAGVTLHDVDWETYCQLRDEESNNHVRMMYLDGELTIMSPLARHDLSSRRFYEVVTAVARASRIPYLPFGTTTLRKKGRARRKGSGKEPDEGFYLGNIVTEVENIDDLDLTIHPPPSLAVEIDNSGDSRRALLTYARIKVPEVWVYKVRDRSLWFGRLAKEGYEAIDRSLGLPRLTPELVLQALEARKNLDELHWHDWLAAWARTLAEPPAVGG